MFLQFSNYFFRASPEDLKIIEQTSKAYLSTKRMQTLTGKKGNALNNAIEVIISYPYFMVKKFDGIFISKNHATLMLYFQKSKYYSSFRDHLHYLYMALFAIGIFRLKKNYLREKKNKSIRESQIKKNEDEDYLYVWMLAQNIGVENNLGLFEAKNHIIQKSITLNLPIYMETTEERLVPLYERAGFQFYHSRKDEISGLTFWFGRWENQNK